jgi:hypothetical protein
MTLKQKFLLAAIIVLAIFFRFYKINVMPGGLFPDMAANGLDINLMQAGHLQPFYERGNGREALFFYMEWASVAMFGKGVWQFSIVSALMGVLAVIMCYFVCFRLFLTGEDYEDLLVKKRAINISLLAAFLMAVSSWHMVLSRTAFRATLIPLFSALAIYFLLRTYQATTKKAKVWFAILFGASLALGFYTYIAFRIMAAVLFMALFWPLLAKIRESKFWSTVINYKLAVLGSLLAFAVFFFPLGKYFYTHPGSFLGRAGQVSVFNQSLYTVDGVQLVTKPSVVAVVSVMGEVFKTQFLGFFTQGDLNWRQNISGYPFLSPLISPFFGAGLAVVVVLGIWYFFAPNKRARWWKYYLLVGWFFGMLLPVITTAEGIPHGLRGIGVIPPVFIISAWALYEFAQIMLKLHKKLWQRVLYKDSDPQWIRDSHFTPPRLRLVNFSLKVLVACFCLALILQTYFLYFVMAYNDPANFYYFRSDLTPVSQYLVKRCDKQHTYLVLDQFSVQTTDYLTSNRYGNFNDPCNVPYHQVDPEHAWQLSGLTLQDEIVFTQSSVFDTVKFKQYHPETYLYMEIRNQFGQAVMAVYRVK